MFAFDPGIGEILKSGNSRYTSMAVLAGFEYESHGFCPSLILPLAPVTEACRGILGKSQLPEPHALSAN